MLKQKYFAIVDTKGNIKDWDNSPWQGAAIIKNKNSAETHLKETGKRMKGCYVAEVTIKIK